MGDIVNLRQARKRKARDEDGKRADANRQRFGQSKSARDTHHAEQARSQTFLDGHRLSGTSEDADD